MEFSNLLILLILIVGSVDHCYAASFKDNFLTRAWNKVNRRNVHWTDLNFSSGDILRCRINVFADHILLATSSSTVAHMVGDVFSNDGNLVEETWSEFHEREGNFMSKCRVHGRATLSDAVERARRDIEQYSGRDIYYNLLSCNCEHWVNYWAIGKAVSYQAIFHTDSECDI